MATWRELERVRKAPHEFRQKAAFILSTYSAGLDDWQALFLNSIVDEFKRAKEFSLRQAETLYDIENRVTPITMLRDGFSVEILLKKCHEARADLSDSDEEFIARLRSRSLTHIRGSEAGRLLRCAHLLNLIDTEVE